MRQLAGVMTQSIAIGAGRLVDMLATVSGMIAAMTGVCIGHHVLVDVRTDLEVLAGLLMNRRASHAEAAGNRLKRKQGDEQPNEQFLENAVHSGGEYSTTFFAWADGLRLAKVIALAGVGAPICAGRHGHPQHLLLF